MAFSRQISNWVLKCFCIDLYESYLFTPVYFYSWIFLFKEQIHQHLMNKNRISLRSCKSMNWLKLQFHFESQASNAISTCLNRSNWNSFHWKGAHIFASALLIRIFTLDFNSYSNSISNELGSDVSKLFTFSD